MIRKKCGLLTQSPKKLKHASHVKIKLTKCGTKTKCYRFSEMVQIQISESGPNPEYDQFKIQKPDSRFWWFIQNQFCQENSTVFLERKSLDLSAMSHGDNISCVTRSPDLFDAIFYFFQDFYILSKSIQYLGEMCFIWRHFFNSWYDSPTGIHYQVFATTLLESNLFSVIFGTLGTLNIHIKIISKWSAVVAYLCVGEPYF